MKYKWCLSALALLVLSCGGRKQMSPEELEHKLDSIKSIEVKEKLKLQGVDLETSDNPLKIFYDSLSMQTLPVSYTEDFVRYLEYFPVDKLCLYAVEDKSDEISPEEFVQFFSITSDYEIHLLDFSKSRNQAQSEEIYYVDASRHFVLRETKLE